MDGFMADDFFGIGAYDERAAFVADELRKYRTERLRALVEQCKTNGDTTFRSVIEHWIRNVSYRIRRGIDRVISIPAILAEALGLASRRVLLTKKDELWCGDRLLFSPTP
jgi:hypothetical protein